MPPKSAAKSARAVRRREILKYLKDPLGPYFKHLRRELAAGDRMAILLGVQACAQEGVPMPDWLADAYLCAVKKVFQDGEKSWDAAFGKPWPRVAAKSIRHYVDKAIAVHMAIDDRPSGVPIDVGLFEMVGEHLGLRPSAVRDLYYSKNNPIVKARQLRKKSKISGITRGRK